ncbi:hypothetical protein TWF694_011775 [Orbilia ellipsospora]|uniref:Secreted protein n=1 Tax=Orbilia ellipsospora TaxID=2528407 RepID=A0AAV9X694_9PEZI
MASQAASQWILSTLAHPFVLSTQWMYPDAASFPSHACIIVPRGTSGCSTESACSFGLEFCRVLTRFKIVPELWLQPLHDAMPAARSSDPSI